MKRTLKFFVMIFIANVSYSQNFDNKYIGNVEYIMKYRKANGEFNEVLYIKTYFNKGSHFFTTSNPNSKSQETLTQGFENLNKNSDSLENSRISKDLLQELNSLEVLKEFVFYDKKQSAITQQFSSKKYLIIDTLVDLKYEYTKDTMTIDKFICQKAIYWNQNQKTEIWFTTDIPFKVGPLKYHGLPGLILKVVSNEGKQVIVFSKIEYPLKTEKTIEFTKYTTIEKVDYDKKISNFKVKAE